MEVLQAAVEAAKKNNLTTLVIASTTGNTASKLSDLVKEENLRVIVVTHDEGKPPGECRFNTEIKRRLLAHHITVYTHKPQLILLRKIIGKIAGKFGFPRWYRHLREVKERYGTGIKVCHIIVKMLMEGRVLREGRVVAIAGTKSGADSVAIFLVKPQNKWPILEEVIINHS